MAVRARSANTLRPISGEEGGAADDDPADLAGVGYLGHEVERVMVGRLGLVGRFRAVGGIHISTVGPDDP